MESLSVKVVDWNPGDLIDNVKLKIDVPPEFVHDVLLRAIQDGMNIFQAQREFQILTTTATIETSIEVKISYKVGNVDVTKYVKEVK